MEIGEADGASLRYSRIVGHDEPQIEKIDFTTLEVALRIRID